MQNRYLVLPNSGSGSDLRADGKQQMGVYLLKVSQQDGGRHLVKRLMAFLLGFAAAAAAWSYANYVSSYAVVHGEVALQNETIAVTPGQTGKLVAIDVVEGQRVGKGEIVAELDTPEAIAARTEAEQRMAEAKAEVVRHQAGVELVRRRAFAAADAIAWDAVVPRGIAVRQAQLFRAEMAQTAEAFDRIAEKRSEAEARRDRAKAAVAAQRAYIAVISEELRMRDQLAKQNADSRIHVLDAEKDVRRAEIDLAAAESSLAEANAILSSLDDQSAKICASFIRRKEQELAEAKSIASDQEAQLARFSQQASLIKLVSPEAGTVKGTLSATVGRMVTRDEPLLEIEPADRGTPEIVAYLPLRDAALVSPEQEAVIEVQPSIRGRSSVLTGRVARVQSASDDAVKTKGGASSSAKTAPLYEVLVQPGSPVPGSKGAVALTPGMQVSVGIKTDKRRLIDYLLAPISALSPSATRLTKARAHLL